MKEGKATKTEWLDLRALTDYAAVSERTLRTWIHRAHNPLPAARVGAKVLVKRETFDRWLEAQPARPTDFVDAGKLAEQIMAELVAN